MKEGPCLDWGITQLIINMGSPIMEFSEIESIYKFQTGAQAWGCFVPPEDGLILKGVFVQPIKQPCQFYNHSVVERSPAQSADVHIHILLHHSPM